MNKYVVITLNDNGLNEMSFMSLEAANNFIVNEVVEELRENPGYQKWTNKNQIAVINEKEKKLLSIRTLIVEDILTKLGGLIDEKYR